MSICLLGFGQNLFAFAPTEDNSNQVTITNEFNSYDCPIHTDKVTSTQITCYAPAMPEGTYTVRVKVNGNLIPLHQYINVENADVRSVDWNTPKLTSLEPISAPPGSMVTLKGDFKTLCYTRDQDPCADDAGARISRIYFNGQLCNLINPDTNLVYQNLTTDSLVCKLEGHEVNVYNATVLVSEEYGRSLTSPTIFYITADEQIYNFESYAEIDHVNYQTGSINGGLKLTLTGNHFYSDESVKAEVKIGNEECKLIAYMPNNFFDSVLECQVPVGPGQNRSHFYGGRGLNLVVENVETDFDGLLSYVPSSSAAKYVTNRMSVSLRQADPATVRFTGYFAPLRSGRYDFPIDTDGYAKVCLSLTQDPNDKTVVSSYEPSSADYSKVYLEAGKYYYIESIGSSSLGSFEMKINARFYDTSLVDTVTSNVKNEIQEIEIRSSEKREEFVIF
ncbi:Fibrocystin-L [Brachionus plicatilis]|uniref:Fibrocystin-L n=1 Tax=Brachionus plicatilis TaxID=10195 RepID=A0A3M7PD64_BRAPC|nr:Fibrocystin-L [Brachionus plicatilis]